MGSLLLRRSSVCAAALCGSFLIGACLPGGGSADKTRSTSPSSTLEPTSEDGEGGETETFDAPEQQEVDRRTARRALPTASDLPGTGWRKITWAHSDTTSTYDPPECAALGFGSESAESYREKHRSVSESAAFSRSGAGDGGMVEVYLESYGTPYPLAYFDEAGESLTACAEYTVGGDVTYTASAIPPPLLGERAFGVRISAAGRHRDLLFVRSGHNLIHVAHTTTAETYDERFLEKYAEGALEELEKNS